MFPWLCVKDTLLTTLLGKFIEPHNTQFFKRLANLTWDCIALVFSIHHFESIYIYERKRMWVQEVQGELMYKLMYINSIN